MEQIDQAPSVADPGLRDEVVVSLKAKSLNGSGEAPHKIQESAGPTCDSSSSMGNDATAARPLPNGADDKDGEPRTEPEHPPSQQDEGVVVYTPDQLPAQAKKKKKKNKTRPQGQRGLDKPSGFEEYYADAPLTPDQHLEERELYDQSISFTERILTAIQRYERRRKMNSEMRDIFYKYLAYGGVDVGSNAFQGRRSKEELEDMDKDQTRMLMAQTNIMDDKGNIGKDPTKWVVDFVGTLKGFLSRRAPYCYGFETQAQVTIITTVLGNFMNYLMLHEVCPEYSSDILAARQICKLASVELWSVAEAQRWLPGDFNVACSTLFDGGYARNFDGQTSWRPDNQGFVGMTEEIANHVARFAVAAVADEEAYQKWYDWASQDKLEVTEVREAVGFGITRIEPVSNETRELYKEKCRDYRPVGKIFAKPWHNPENQPEDLSLEEKAKKAGMEEKQEAMAQEAGEVVYEFFIEEVVLQHLFVGMKIEATVRKLNCGIWFFDELLRCYPSFDTYLANEMIIGWKEPRTMKGAPWGAYAMAEEEAVNEKGAAQEPCDDE